MLFSLVISVASLSLAVAVLVVLTGPLHARWSADRAGQGIQKHHHGSPPRVGLIPILAGCVLAAVLLSRSPRVDGADVLFAQLLLCGQAGKTPISISMRMSARRQMRCTQVVAGSWNGT